MSSIYVTTDGTYGDASDLQIFRTNHWTPQMFDALDSESDSRKIELAKHFSDVDNHEFEIQMIPADRKEGNPLIPLNVCSVCDLSPSQLSND